MIAINYLAATAKNFGLSFGANTPMQTADEETESQNLKENNAIFNFANFFDSGIDLTDNSLVFGDSSDYYGWMFHGVTEQTPTKDFELVITALETIDLADGLTIAFNKGYSCAQIKVYLGETLAATVTAGETENYRLPAVNKITFTQTQTDENIKIVLQERYGATCCPNIKGVYFGNSIDIDEVFDYDHIAEIDPLSNDLPINESNFTAYILLLKAVKVLIFLITESCLNGRCFTMRRKLSRMFMNLKHAVKFSSGRKTKRFIITRCCNRQWIGLVCFTLPLQRLAT